MNYLAHLFLSGNNEGLIIGNFIGDFVKGDDYLEFPLPIQKGIKMHRFIDHFTDHHPQVHASKQYFVAEFDKYSGVLVDVFYDHLLAKHFSDFSDQALNELATEKYRILNKNRQHLQPGALRFLAYMMQYNLLETYKDIQVIHQVLEGLTARIHERVILQQAVPLFLKNELALKEQFGLFFAEIRQQLNEFTKD